MNRFLVLSTLSIALISSIISVKSADSDSSDLSENETVFSQWKKKTNHQALLSFSGGQNTQRLRRPGPNSSDIESTSPSSSFPLSQKKRFHLPDGDKR